MHVTYVRGSALLWPFSGGFAIRYILPVLWTTSYLHIMATNRRHGIIFCYPQFSATRQRKSYLSRQRNHPPPEKALFGGHIWARPDSPAVDILNAVRWLPVFCRNLSMFIISLRQSNNTTLYNTFMWFSKERDYLVFWEHVHVLLLTALVPRFLNITPVSVLHVRLLTDWLFCVWGLCVRVRVCILRVTVT